jgi:phytoene synthase
MDAPSPRQPDATNDCAMEKEFGETALLRLLRQRDPDRHLVVLFAPPDRRAALAALYAFNQELARVPELAHEPQLGLIRVQWWRQVVEGDRCRHEVASPLGAALDAGLLRAADLAPLLAAREAELSGPIATVTAWQAYVENTDGALALAAGRALGAGSTELVRLSCLGTAFGVGRLLRQAADLARRERCLLPEDLLVRHGLSRATLLETPRSHALAAVVAELAAWGRERLAAGAGPLPRSLLAAGLVGTLARRDLRRIALSRPGRAAPRGLGDRLAVFAAALRGRV